MTEIRITDPKTGGQKGQKPERYDLLPFDALDEVARVYGVGALKYDDDNWTKGYAWRLSAGALLRHVARFMVGEDRDPETGCLHLAHAAWHCLTLLAFFMRGLGTDDRCVPPEPRAAWDLDFEGFSEGDLDDAAAPIPYKLKQTFKVGDRVRVVSPDDYHDECEGVVVSFDSPAVYCIDIDGDEWSFDAAELVAVCGAV